MNKKNINMIMYAIILIGIVLFGSGIYLLINKNSPSTKKTLDVKEEQLNDQDKIDTRYGRKRNTSDAIKEKHCLDKLCIIDIENILESGSIGAITGNIVNEGDSPVPAGYLKFTFTVGDTEEKLVFYHEELPIGEKIPLEIQHSNEKIVEATNLKIEIPTAEEIKKAENESIA